MDYVAEFHRLLKEYHKEQDPDKQVLLMLAIERMRKNAMLANQEASRVQWAYRPQPKVKENR